MNLKPIAIALLCGGTVLPAVFAADLQIPAGQSHRLDPALATAHFQTWKLGDGATLMLPEGVAHWRWEVDRAEIGNGVRIQGVGAAGSVGAAGKDRGGRSASCRDGAAGGAGIAGGAGGAGADIDLRLGLAALGSLTIEVPGGNGGAGGHGGRGQDGGDARTCPGGDGGAGGAGGDGGVGGDGGEVRVRYFRIPGAAAPSDPVALIRVSAEPGKGGAGGKAGSGGKGGEGGYVQARTLTGNQQWVAGGKAGDAGAEGKAGVAGDRVAAIIESDVDRRLDQLLEDRPAPVTAAPAADDRYRAMELELEVLRRRLDALEKSGGR